MYAWAGTILRVDLSSGQIEKEPLDENLRRNYIGGRGINSKILYDEVGPDVGALDPENRLIYGTSPLVGTSCPSANRCTITAKSPYTDILGDGNVGGHFSPELKFAGYDHIVFQGRAEKPVYLWIDNDHVELRDAGHLWAKDTRETERMIKEDVGDSRIQISSIGQAGENLVNFACVMVNLYRAAGKTGMGAVMGSKNLKAVAVRGAKGVKVAKPEIFSKLSRNLVERIKKNPVYSNFSTYGTIAFEVATNEIGFLNVKNYQRGGEYDKIKRLSHEAIAKKHYVKNMSCFNCPNHCSHLYRVKEGPYAGLVGGGFEYTNICTGGSNWDVSYVPALLKLDDLCDRFGLDTWTFGCVIAHAMDWYENGIITRKDTDGIDLKWGNHEAVIEMFHKIIKKEGFGALLANGSTKAAKEIGKGAEYYVSHSKGLPMAGDDVRPLKGYALCVATGTRGGDHLRGLVSSEFWGDQELAEQVFGYKEAGIPTSYNKARAAIIAQDMCTLADCLQICKWSTQWVGSEIGIEDMRELFCAATGIDMNEENTFKVADRVWNLERAYLVREGITRKDDALEGKFGVEPVPNGPYKGEKIDKDKFKIMLDDYYERRGWDKETGTPTRERLESLGLKKVADELEKMEKL